MNILFIYRYAVYFDQWLYQQLRFYYYFLIIIIIIIIIIFKISSAGPSETKKMFCKLLEQPHKHLHCRTRKIQLRKATHGWQIPLRHPTNQTQIRQRVDHSMHERKQAGSISKIMIFIIFCISGYPSLNDEQREPLEKVYLYEKQRAAHHRNSASGYNWPCTTYTPATWRRCSKDERIWSGECLAPKRIWRWRSWRWESAAEPQTGEQYSRIVTTKA